MMRGLVKRLIYSVLPPATIDRLKVAQFYKIFDEFTESNFPEAPALASLIKPGDTVLDIGSNVGLVTKLLAQFVGPNGRVHTYEPVPYTYSILKSNVERAELRQVRCYDCAVSEHDGEATIDVPTYAQMPDSRDRGSLRSSRVPNYYAAHLRSGRSGVSGAGSSRVQVRSIDSMFAADANRIALIKCDAEGHEYSCMLGARAILERDHPALFIELCSDPTQEGSQDHNMLIYLKDLGYAPFVFVDGSLRPYEPDTRTNDLFFLAT
jgi:FkbM family methyltransferase